MNHFVLLCDSALKSADFNKRFRRVFVWLTLPFLSKRA